MSVKKRADRIQKYTKPVTEIPHSNLLEAVLSDNHLVVHHVGGRAGTRDFPVLPAFERGIINVLYDADESCLPQIMGAWGTHPSKTIVLPYCLAAQAGTCKFHINYDPFTSSVYPLNPKYAQFYYLDSARYDPPCQNRVRHLPL